MTRWVVHAIFAIPLLAALALAVWLIAVSAGPLLHTAGVMLILIIAGVAVAKMRGV